MGKASRRVREKSGRTQPRISPAVGKVLVAPGAPTPTGPPAGDLDGGRDLVKRCERACPAWDSHEEAIHFFEEVLGWKMARHVPEYASDLFCDALKRRMNQPRLQFVDRTAVVALGPRASQSELVDELAAMILECEKHPNRVLLLLRTAHNTPAFLGGLWTWFVEDERGEREAREHLQKQGNPTAGLLIVNAEGLKIVPTQALSGGLRMGVGMTAMLLNQNPDEFVCCVCHGTFVRDDTGGRGLLTAVGGDCGHPYHPQCLLDHIQRYGGACHACNRPLPPDLVPARFVNSLERVCRERFRGLSV